MSWHIYEWDLFLWRINKRFKVSYWYRWKSLRCPILWWLNPFFLHNHWSFTMKNQMQICICCISTASIIRINVNDKITRNYSTYCSISINISRNYCSKIEISILTFLNLSPILKQYILIINYCLMRMARWNHRSFFL